MTRQTQSVAHRPVFMLEESPLVPKQAFWPRLKALDRSARRTVSEARYRCNKEALGGKDYLTKSPFFLTR